MNNYEEMENVNDIAEEVKEGKPSFKERYLNRKTVMKFVKIILIGVTAVAGTAIVGALATPKELNYPEGAPFDDEDDDDSKS